MRLAFVSVNCWLLTNFNLCCSNAVCDVHAGEASMDSVRGGRRRRSDHEVPTVGANVRLSWCSNYYLNTLIYCSSRVASTWSSSVRSSSATRTWATCCGTRQVCIVHVWVRHPTRGTKILYVFLKVCTVKYK